MALASVREGLAFSTEIASLSYGKRNSFRITPTSASDSQVLPILPTGAEGRPDRMRSGEGDASEQDSGHHKWRSSGAFKRVRVQECDRTHHQHKRRNPDAGKRGISR